MASQDHVLDELRVLIAKEFDLDPSEITAAREIADFGLDSLSLAEFAFLIEDNYEVSVYRRGSAVKTIGDVLDLIEAHRPVAVRS